MGDKGMSFLAFRHSFTFTISLVRGKRKANLVVDTISRFQFQRFWQLAPLADQAHTAIPFSLLSTFHYIYFSWQDNRVSSDSFLLSGDEQKLTRFSFTG